MKKGKGIYRKDAKVAKNAKARMEKDPSKGVAVLGEFFGFAVKKIPLWK